MINISRRFEIEERIVKKAWADDNFKKALLADPKAVLEKELKVKFPEKFNVKVIEESFDTVYIVLPTQPPMSRTSKADSTGPYGIETYIDNKL